MKVGLISFHSFYKPGGVKRHILGLYKEFKKRKIETKIIVPRRSFRENYGKDVILLGTSFPINFGGTQSDFDINFNPLSIERTLKKEKFDILHLHNFGFPSVLQILASPFTSHTLNILTFHSNVEGSKFLKRFPSLLYLLNKICQWKIDGIIGVAPLNLKYFKNFKGPKIVIPNGIDLEEFNPKVPELKKFSDGKINILFIGRIEERKGLIYLLKAFKILKKKFSNLRLIIVGEGELKKECENYVKENNLKRVYFEGKKTGKELASYYTSCDIFCAPSIFGESFGIVLLEAMACGKPVVAFANEGYKEFLKGKRGLQPTLRPPAFGGPLKFLAKPRNFRELAQKLEILIKNPELRKEMGEWGIKEAKKYSWPKIADRVLEFYQFCQKQKEKRPEKPFSLKAILNKVDAVLQKDILDWLR
jgi:phosphatidylinositol alpha-mannosyltransferase